MRLFALTTDHKRAAGVGNMQYRAFALYNVGGAAVWTLSFVLAGYFFGARLCTLSSLSSHGQCDSHAHALIWRSAVLSVPGNAGAEGVVRAGNFPFVKHNFTLVVLAIVAVSVLPVVFEARSLPVVLFYSLVC